MDYVARTPKQLGQLLKSCRVQQERSQSAVGSKVGIKQSTVSVLEADASAARVATLYKLLSALDLELVIRDRGKTPLAESVKREW